MSPISPEPLQYELSNRITGHFSPPAPTAHNMRVRAMPLPCDAFDGNSSPRPPISSISRFAGYRSNRRKSAESLAKLASQTFRLLVFSPY